MNDDLLTAELEEKAAAVATLLNAIADDDDRERAQEVYERRLNDELYHGSQVRASSAGPCPACGGPHGPECLALPPEFRSRIGKIAIRSRVRRGDGSEGVVLRFRAERLWSYHRCTTIVFAIVDTEYGTEASWPLSDLTVIEAVEGGVR